MSTAEPTQPPPQSNARPRRRAVLTAAALAPFGMAAAGSAAAGEQAPFRSGPLPGSAILRVPSQLAKQDRIFLHRGLMHGAWVRSGSADGWIPGANEWATSGFNAPTFYNPPLYSTEVMERLDAKVWALAKGPRGTHLEPPPPTTEPLLPPGAHTAAQTLFTACFGDEEAFTEERLGWLTSLYDRMRVEYPHVLVHNNQAVGQYPDAEMRRYVAQASPDLLTFDFYYFHRAVQYAGGSVSSLYRHTGRYRRLALEGRHGDGTEPLSFGQYTTAFRLHPPTSPDATPVFQLRELFVSESQQAVVSHVTWALGGKWLDAFRWEHGGDQESIRTDGLFFRYPDDRPTPQLFRYEKLNRTMRAYSPYLVRLRTAATGLVRGIVAETGARTPQQGELADFSAQTDPGTGVVAITATNVGTANSGQPGDVVFGSFRALPGMTAGEARGVLPDRASTTAFMLVNTLVWRNEDWANAAGTGGDGDQTAQVVTVTINRAALGSSTSSTASLYRVDPDTGVPQVVALAAGGGGTYSFDVRLRGGESGLYFWG